MLKRRKTEADLALAVPRMTLKTSQSARRPPKRPKEDNARSVRPRPLHVNDKVMLLDQKLRPDDAILYTMSDQGMVLECCAAGSVLLASGIDLDPHVACRCGFCGKAGTQNGRSWMEVHLHDGCKVAIMQHRPKRRPTQV